MRRYFTAGATLLLLLTALVVGPGRANADGNNKPYCTDSFPSTTTAVIDGGPMLYLEYYNSYVGGTGYLGDDTFVGICYSDTASSSPSSAAGGYIRLRITSHSYDRYTVEVLCLGDTPAWLFSLNCNTSATVYITSSTSTSPLSAGAAVSGFFLANGSTLTLGSTGANTGALTTTSGANPDVTYGGTCTTVAGLPLVPCSTGVVDANVAQGDLIPGVVTGSTGTCLLQLGTCQLYLPKAGLAFFRDGSNNTDASLLFTGASDPGYSCVGICLLPT